MDRGVNGADASFAIVDKTWFEAHPEFQVFVQDAFTGGVNSSKGLEKTAARNLLAAKGAGRVACFYANVAPWHTAGKYCIEQAIRVAGVNAWQAADKILVIDVEIMEYEGVTLDPRIMDEAVTEARDRGFRPVIYTAKRCMDIWNRKLGYYPTLSAPIWYARYDNIPEIGDPGFPTFGQPVVGKQCGGGIVDGAEIDINTFDLSFWTGQQPQEENEEDDMKGIIVKAGEDFYFAGPGYRVYLGADATGLADMGYPIKQVGEPGAPRDTDALFGIPSLELVAWAGWRFLDRRQEK